MFGVLNYLRGWITLDNVSIIGDTECIQGFCCLFNDILTLLNKCINDFIANDGDTITGCVSDKKNMDSCIESMRNFARVMECFCCALTPIKWKKDVLVHLTATEYCG